MQTLQELTFSCVEVIGIADISVVSICVAVQYFYGTWLEYEFPGVQVTSYLHSVV